MELIMSILRDPVWQGISGLLAFLALMLTFDRPKNYISSLFGNEWLLSSSGRILIVGLFIFLVSVFTIQLAFRYGIAVSISSGLVLLSLILLIRVFKLNNRIDELSSAIEAKESYSQSLLVSQQRIISAHMVPFTLDKWEYDAFINEDGDEVTEEHQIIRPKADIVYFRKLKYGFLPSSQSSDGQISIEAYNGHTGSPLLVNLIQETPSMIICSVLLEPPATSNNPFWLNLKIVRRGAWKPLLEKGEDVATLDVDSSTKRLRVRFFLPSILIARSFTVIPRSTEERSKTTIGKAGESNYYMFQASNVTTQRFTFTLFAKKQNLP